MRYRLLVLNFCRSRFGIRPRIAGTSARGADYAPFRVEVTGPGVSVVSSGAEAGGAFDQKLATQPYFVTGNWDPPVTASGVSVFLPKGSGAPEQKVANELAGLASEAKAFVANLLGPGPDVSLRLVAVRRAGGFTGGGTILIDDSVFRRGRLDSQTAMTIAESVTKMWIGGSISADRRRKRRDPRRTDEAHRDAVS